MALSIVRVTGKDGVPIPQNGSTAYRELTLSGEGTWFDHPLNIMNGNDQLASLTSDSQGNWTATVKDLLPMEYGFRVSTRDGENASVRWPVFVTEGK